MQKFYVYWLLDPDTKKPRYVGVTNHPKGRRLQHLHCREKATADWIYYLKSQNKEPYFSVVSVADNAKDINRMETIHIQSLLKKGVELLNRQLCSSYGSNVSKSYTRPSKIKPIIKEPYYPSNEITYTESPRNIYPGLGDYLATEELNRNTCTLECLSCGEKFVSSNHHKGNHKYCSAKCRIKQWRNNKAGNNK